MLPSLQQSAGQFATTQLRSMLDDIETRRREDDDKAKGREREDKVVGTTQDASTAAANEKINAYFFGALKIDPDPFATLVARFSDALGLAQHADESSRDFARRLSDAVTMLGFAKADSRGQPVKISLETLGVAANDVIAVLRDGVNGSTDAMAALAARVAGGAGLTGEEEDFEARLSAALMETRAALPKSVAALEKATGLTELGLSAQDMIAAIANPWSDAGLKVKDALAERAEGERSMTREMRKVIQRLEDVADPKTLEELQEERTKSEPGRIEDEETKAEREQKIQDLKASEKLEDVQDLQDAVKEHLDETGEAVPGEEATTAAEGSLELIQILAAVPSGGDRMTTEPSSGEDNAGVEPDATGQTAEALSEALPEANREEMAAQLEDFERQERTGALDPILVLPVDEIGIYELLRREAA